jgi:hypothetical protein
MIQIIDNVLDEDSCDVLYDIVKNIRYHYNVNTSNLTKLQSNNPLEFDVGQFTSPIIIDSVADYTNNKHIKLITPIVSKLNEHVDINNVNRLKVNLLLKQNIGTDQYNTPHRDPGRYSFVYYLNDSDGDTFFFNDDMSILNRVTPKKNSGVLFDSNILHASSNPATTDARFVLNFVFN